MNPKLAQIYSQIPKSACPPGCGRCCGILFPALSEIRNIREWCAQKHIEYRDFTMDPEADCPYLMPDKTCQIYPVRPFLCRILGVTTDPRLRCKEGLKPERLLNPLQARHLMNQIYGTRKEKGREAKHQRDLEKIFEGMR